MIYFITQNDDPLVSLLYKLSVKNRIPSQIINISNPGLKISFSPGEILINNKLLEENSLIYIHNINYEFPHIPDEPLNNDWTVFQDFHTAQQQSKSHLYSLLSLLSENKNYKVVNDFIQVQKFVIKSDMLDLLYSSGFDVPDYIVTNQYNEIAKSKLFSSKNNLLWSFPESGSPVKKINKKRLNELFKDDNPIPFIVFADKKGYAARVIFYEKTPVLITLIEKPSSKKYEEQLEKFHHIKPHSSLQKFGSRLFKLFGLKYYEIHGIIDEEEKFWFYDVTFNLNINLYSFKTQQYVISKLLELFSEEIGEKIDISSPFEEYGIRKTVFLKRMLNPLFEIQHKTE